MGAISNLNRISRGGEVKRIVVHTCIDEAR